MTQQKAPGLDFSSLVAEVSATWGATVGVAVLAALEAGEEVKGNTSPNPPVGAALFDARGVLAVGATAPAGGAHAEINALTQLAEKGISPEGLSIAVTLEPCNHTGRTGPCSHALLEAGIAKVFYLTADTNPQAQGGAEFLREHGVEVTFIGVTVPTLQYWLASIRNHRPSVTVKWAHTLDGYIAAPDGTSQWITGEVARAFVHHDRAQRDAIIVGTGTVVADNPRLSARRGYDTAEAAAGTLYEHQPVRVVIGRRTLGHEFHLGMADGTSIIHAATIEQALQMLWETGARDVLVEGGAGLVSSFFEQGLVDFVQDYQAPALLGRGKSLSTWPYAQSMTEIVRFERIHTQVLGQDVMSLLAAVNDGRSSYAH